MSKKKKRKFVPDHGGSGGSATTPPKTEAARRRDSWPSGGASEIFQRNRGIIIGVIVVAAVGVMGFFVLQSATASAYTCDAQLTEPSAETGPQGSGELNERLGFVVEDSGRRHSGSALRYATCPPTSGDHRGGGALTRQFFGPASVQVPNNWVHNLEHGYAIVAYAGDPGADVIRQLRSSMDDAAPSEVAEACGLPNKVIALRFDDMSEPFAVLAWDRALLMDTFDAELVTRAATQFQDQPQAPERAC